MRLISFIFDIKMKKYVYIFLRFDKNGTVVKLQS